MASVQKAVGTVASRPTGALAVRRRRFFGPLAVSAAAHVALLVVLGVIVVAVDTPAKPVAIMLDMTEQPSLDEGAAVEIPSATESTEAASSGPEVADAIAALAIEPVPAMEPLIAGSHAAASLQAEIQEALIASEVPMEALLVTDMLAGNAVAQPHGGGAHGSGRGGAGSRGPAASVASFFGHAGQGRSGRAQSVCFICDNSNSYRDGGFHAVLDELARAVDSLAADQSFFVVFFSDAAYPLFHPAAAATLQPATADSKRKLREWLATVEMCSGGRGIHEAVTLAGTLGADVVYFLSDGDHAASVVEGVVTADFGAAVVHTYGVQQSLLDRRTGLVDPERLQEQQLLNHNLLSIANAHGGRFTPVTIPPQAALLERVRPIPKNRFRGAVWGVKL